MKEVYVLYDSSITAVIGIFKDLNLVEQQILKYTEKTGADPKMDFFVYKVCLGEIYVIGNDDKRLAARYMS